MNGESGGTAGGTGERVVPQVTVVAEDGRRIGVRVMAYRSRTLLVMLDLDSHPAFFSKASLPPTANAWVHAVADLIAEDPDYHWDTQRYRDLCMEGGLDPDQGRPTFTKADEDVGSRLVRMVSVITNAPSHACIGMLFDLIDALRTDDGGHRRTVEDLRGTFGFMQRYEPAAAAETIEMVRAAGMSGTALFHALTQRE